MKVHRYRVFVLFTTKFISDYGQLRSPSQPTATTRRNPKEKPYKEAIVLLLGFETIVYDIHTMARRETACITYSAYTSAQGTKAYTGGVHEVKYVRFRETRLRQR